MGNASGRQLSAAERGRRPNDNEMLVLFKIQRALFQRLVASPEHLQLLQQYWTAIFRRKYQMPGFVLVSDLWKEAGFSASNPAIDLNPTGELGLRCLVFFVETYPAESAMMRRGRGGYHFVKAAIAVVRILSLRLHLMDTVGNPGPFPVTCTLYWQLIKHETEFFHFFSLAFLVFEELFCEEVATNLWMKDMDTCSMAVMDKLVGAVDLKLENELKKAPLELADLQDLCSNGRYIVDKMNENRRAADIDKKTFKDGESGLVSRWSQHQNPKRKTLQEIGRTWGKEEKDECYKNNVYRLKPRMPEIERHHSDNLQVSGTTSDAKVSPRRSKAVEIDKIDPLEQTAIDSSHDLFAGLTTKTKLALDESKNIENVASLELAPVA